MAGVVKSIFKGPPEPKAPPAPQISETTRRSERAAEARERTQKQRQRAAVARIGAANRGRRLLLFDDPTGVRDLPGRLG